MSIKQLNFKKLFSSRKVIWLAIAALFILYLHMISSFNSFENKIDRLLDDSDARQIEQVEELSKEISSLKESLCDSISRLFELNGKFYSCIIGGLNQ